MNSLPIRYGTVLVILIAGLTLAVARPASAHVLKTDGAIGAILHVNPDDEPTNGIPTSYILSFRDTTNRFNLESCLCTATLLEGSQTVLTRTLTPSYPQQSVNNITFPDPAVYTLRIAGDPRQPGSFQPFVLSYLVRVTGDSASSQPASPLVIIGTLLTGILLLLGIYHKNNHNVSAPPKEDL